METLTNIKVQVVGALELLDNLWFNVRTSFLPKRALGSTEHSPGAVLGKTCIVTGANCGIGLATASVFASRGANVILACRSIKRGEAAAKVGFLISTEFEFFSVCECVLYLHAGCFLSKTCK